MNPADYERIFEVFRAALERPAAERAAFLDDSCDSDGTLRQEVEALLAADAEPDDAFAETGLRAGRAALMDALSGSQSTDSDDDELPDRIGRYRVIRKIGQGGMGTVYEAEQENPKRTVAVKVLRGATSTRDMVQRFSRETQFLARLEHPGIARIFEAGTAQTMHGTAPYFAMELVRGDDLLDHATARQLDTQKKLALFAQVCDAVQAAHQQSVVHRDLKPSNILIAESADGIAQPKILDFGVARALEPDIQQATTQTTIGQLIGTLAYMSPEQVTGDPTQVDTRSDVYSLGVILYELLGGELPHDVRSCSIAEAARMIRDDDPVRLSSINRTLDRDVETICNKALEKDKTRRYQSASDIAVDIRHYLRHEPIEARRDSTLYVLGKSLRRHRAMATSMATIFVLVLVFGVVSFIQAKQNQQLADDEHQARLDADRQLRSSNIERGRLMGFAGGLEGAEDLIWREYLLDPESRQARWALRELYSRHRCLATLSGHVGTVWDVDMNPDGSLFATCGEDDTIKLWDPTTKECEATLVGHAGDVRDVAFSRTPGDTRLASCSLDGTIKIWDTSSFNCVKTWRHGVGGVKGLAFAPNGLVLASGGIDSVVRLWDASSALCLLTLPSNQAGVERLCFSPNGQHLASAGTDGSIKLWKLGYDHSLQIEEQGTSTLAGHTRAVRSLAFSPDGRTLASGSVDRTIRLWDLATGKSAEPLRPSNGTITGLAFSTDGQTLFEAGWWSIGQWDIPSQQRVSSIKIQQGAYFLSLTSDGRGLCTGDADGNVRLWETAPNRWLTALKPHHGPSRVLGVADDGRIAASVAADHTVHLWDVNTLDELATLRGHETSPSNAFFNWDATLVATAVRNEVIKLWVVATGTCLATMDDYSGKNRLAFSPDGRFLISGRPTGMIDFWEIPSGRRTRTLKAAEGEILAMCFSPDGTILATVGRSGPIHLWDTTDYSLLARFHVPFHSYWCLDISPDNRILAAGNWGRTVELWDIPSRKHVAVLAGHTARIDSVDFAPENGDGAGMLASASVDGTIKIWDTESGLCLLTLQSDTGSAIDVLFVTDSGADQPQLLSIHADRSLSSWRLTYYDRHIAGNLGHQIERQIPQLADAIDDDFRARWDSEMSFRAKSTLGASLVDRGRYAEAEPLLLEYHRHLMQTSGISSTDSREAMDRLIDLYEAWQKPEQAREYRTEFAATFPGMVE